MPIQRGKISSTIASITYSRASSRTRARVLALPFLNLAYSSLRRSSIRATSSSKLSSLALTSTTSGPPSAFCSTPSSARTASPESVPPSSAARQTFRASFMRTTSSRS
jgi:hypothetical protein